MAIIVNGTAGISNATWTTATRPASPVAGQTGFNTDIGAMETYTGSAWSTSDLPATGASGNFLQSTGTAWASASTLAVSNGGTGQTTLTTAYGVLAAGTTATGALQNIGTGTSGQILKSNGPGVLPSFQAAAAGGFSNMTVYTAPGTFTTPSTTTQIKVTVVAGGGGGGSSGGGGGGSAIWVGSVSASTPYAVTRGGGGAGGTVPTGVPGTTGGTSSFVGPVTVSATGGAGAASGTFSAAAGGSGSNGLLNCVGGPGLLIAPSNIAISPGYNALFGLSYGGGGAPGTTGAGGVVVVEY